MKQRILLLDDDPAVRRMLRRVLEDEDYLVTCASNGKEAIQKAAGENVALVLLDLNLPEENGWQVLERLTLDHPAMPVIVITARSNQIFPALASGVGALMEKPLDLPKLLEIIRSLLDEPAEKRLARIAGRPSEFRYIQPPRNKQ